MIFEYGETNRINGFTLSVCVPPFARPTYSFVLDWEKKKKSKASLSDDTEKANNMKYTSSERTIKDANSLLSTSNNSESISFSKSSATNESQKFGGDHHSKFEQKMRMKTKNDETKNQAYDNLDNYERSADNDNMRYKNSRNVIKLKEHRNFMVELKLIIRHYKNNNETTENVTTDKVMISSTLIDALKFLLRNTSISSLDSDYGRLFLFPDGKKVRELPYDQNRYKPLTEFYKHGSGCTLLLEFD